MVRGVIYGATAAAIWGGMYVVSDVVLEIIPPFTLLLLRLILGLMSLSLLVVGKSLPQLDARAWIDIIGVGVIGYGLSLGAQFVGTDLSTAVNGAVVTSATPAFVILFAVLLLHEKLTARRLLAVLLASFGVFVVVDFSQASFNSDTFVGNLFLGSAALTWGLYSVLIRWVSGKYPDIDTLFVTVISFLGGILLIIPASIIELSQRTILITEINLGIILGILFLGIVSTAVAMWLWNRAFVLLDASTASVLFFVQPISGAFLGWVFLGQVLTLTIWIGGLFIASGVILSITRKKVSLPR